MDVSSLFQSLNEVAPSSSSFPSPPLLPFPPLPMEIKRHILVLADTGTLASCSRASLAFLEIASELLYENVEIVGFERLGQLFCERKTSSSAQVEAHLSLSQIKTFTFVADDHWVFSPLHAERCATTLEVVLLVVRGVGIPSVVLPLSKLDELRSHFTSFLTLFNPISISFLPPPHDGESDFHFPTSGSYFDSWIRLRHVTLRDATFAVMLQKDFFPSPRWSISYELPLPFGKSGERSLALTSAMEDLTVAPDQYAGFGIIAFPDPRIGRVEVVLGTEEEMERVKQEFQTMVVEKLGADQVEGRMELISFVVRDISY